MDHKSCKIFDAEDFQRVTRGIRVAECMRTDSLPTYEAASLSQLEDLTISDKLYCSYCSCTFDSRPQQRLHYKLDWHRYNLKRDLSDKKTVTEENFSQLADHDDVSSISGSESDSDLDTTTTPGPVDLDSSDDDGGAGSKVARKLQASRHIKVFFENQEGKIFSVHRCLLHGKKDAFETDEEFVSAAVSTVERDKWAIFMLGGGHFAAAIFNGGEVIEHKTFHCYTVRKGQGGTQSSRDNRSGGSHPKSAGASLRRYNEAALTQHVQDIAAVWSEQLAECHLVFYRATGGNVSVLFGGRNPPLVKRDPRLRTIPFPTRRATFSEVKRVHNVLTTIETHGMAESYQSSFPQSPRKKINVRPAESDATDALKTAEPSPSVNRASETVRCQSPAVDPAPSQDSSESGDAESGDAESDGASFMTQENVTMNFDRDLVEFEDTVPQWVKNKKKKKPRPKKPKVKEDEASPVVLRLCKRLMKVCQAGNVAALKEILGSIGLPEVSLAVSAGGSMEGADVTEKNADDTKEDAEDAKEGGDVIKKDVNDTREGADDKKGGVDDTKEHTDVLLTCLNRRVDDQYNTLLHIASAAGHLDVVRCLMEAGSSPSHRNKKGQSPYVVATTKHMRNLFRRFLAEFPHSFDYTKSMIPSGLTDEMEQEQAEKRRLVKKGKRDREKEKKKEDEAKKAEEAEKERFLKLTDREKRALAAERRLLSTVPAGSAAPVVARCFLCAADMSGKVPFEYDIHRFCSIACLKAHRISQKTSL